MAAFLFLLSPKHSSFLSLPCLLSDEKETECLGKRRKRKAATPKAQTHKSKNNSFLSFLLFSFTNCLSSFKRFVVLSIKMIGVLFGRQYCCFSRFKNNKTLKSTQMTDKKDVKAQSVDELDVLVGQGDIDTKRELAIRLMEGNGVPQNHPKAVALLEDCVALGDADAMLMLAKCCAFGRGMEHDAERAESLISEAANKGNDEALCLMELINDWKG